MKKVCLVLAACAVVSAALVGCGSGSSTESQSVATSSVSSTVVSTIEDVRTIAIGETATIGGWEITVTSIEYAPELKAQTENMMGSNTIAAGEGKQFVIVNAQLKNTAENLEMFLPDTPYSEYTKETLIYDGKYEYSGYSTASALNIYSSLVHTTVSPLETKTGYIAFAVPNEVVESEKPLQLKIEQEKDYKTLDSITFNLR